MQITKTLGSVFLATFLIGYGLVPSTKKISAPVVRSPEVFKEILVQPDKMIRQEEAVSYISAKKFGGGELLDEDYYDENLEYEFDMLETGEFRGDEIKAKSGEIWLGFFAENDTTVVRKTKIDVRRVHDEIADGSNSKRKTGKKVSVKGKNKPLFLLKNTDSIREGKIKTLFNGLTSKEFAEASETERNPTDITKDFVQNYKIGGESYTLRVIRIYSKQANIRFALILERKETKQILDVSRKDDYLATLNWVGDLDRDGKPDLFLSPKIGDNTSEPSLFLSSKADKKNLVKKVAVLLSGDDY